MIEPIIYWRLAEREFDMRHARLTPPYYVRKHRAKLDTLVVCAQHGGNNFNDGVAVIDIEFDAATPEEERARAAQVMVDILTLRWGAP